MKSSNFYGFFRELMGGASQCRRISEWTSEPPNRTSYRVSRLWRKPHRYKGQIFKQVLLRYR